jgi:ATP/maltotriose-dependent transcriptional regulator MalT
LCKAPPDARSAPAKPWRSSMLRIGFSRAYNLKSMRCPACQTERRSDVRFCEACGSPLEASCLACGAPVPVDTTFCGAWRLAELGDNGGALEFFRRGERIATAADNVYSRTAVDICHGSVLAHHGDAADAVRILEPATLTCREKKFVGWLMLALASLGYAYARLGRSAEGISLAKDAIALQEETGAGVNRAYLHLTLAKTALVAGDLEQAEASARTGLAFAEDDSERGWEAWNRWALGEIALRRGDRATAEHEADEAQEIAEELGMRPLVERCRAVLRRVA